MKRRSFLSTILTIGIVGSISGANNSTVTVTHTAKKDLVEASTLSKAPSKSSSELVDYFEASSFGIPTGSGGTAYADFFGYSTGSGTYYYCNFCQNPTVEDGQVLQMRSKNNNSGIVTCTSVGSCAEIIVNWNESTYDGERVLQFFGKDTPYNTPADLYSSSTCGTLLGEITYNVGYYTILTINVPCRNYSADIGTRSPLE